MRPSVAGETESLPEHFVQRCVRPRLDKNIIKIETRENSIEPCRPNYAKSFSLHTLHMRAFLTGKVGIPPSFSVQNLGEKIVNRRLHQGIKAPGPDAAVKMTSNRQGLVAKAR